MYISPFRSALLVFLLAFLSLPFLLKNPEKFSNQESVTDLAIGNSHARSINFQAMGLVGYNGLRSGADIRETFSSFRTLKDQFPSVERVWIPVSPVYLFRDKSLPKWARHSQDLVKFSDAYSEIYDKTLEAQKRIASFWGSPKTWITPIKNIIKPQKNGNSTTVTLEGAEAILTALDMEKLEALANSTACFHLKDTSEQNTANTSRFNSFLTKLNDQDIAVILFMPPFTEEYFHHPLLEKFITPAIEYFSALPSGHGNVQFFDFHDLIKSENYRYFSDDDHLNLSGAKAFSPVLFNAASAKLQVEGPASK